MIVRMLIWVVFLVGGSILGILLDLQWFRALFYNPFWHIVTLIAGIFLLRFVLRISRNTGRFLARIGREGDIPRMETNKIVTEGMYGCMRHPMHFGLLFFPWSIALIIGSPSFIFLIAPIEMLLIILLIKLVEEPGAIRKFGVTYRDYMKQVPMFSLKSSCIKLLLEDQPPSDKGK
jgi:protein-S-isoprenylcysteine O-methyltransferase Ste14